MLGLPDLVPGNLKNPKVSVTRPAGFMVFGIQFVLACKMKLMCSKCKDHFA